MSRVRESSIKKEGFPGLFNRTSEGWSFPIDCSIVWHKSVTRAIPRFRKTGWPPGESSSTVFPLFSAPFFFLFFLFLGKWFTLKTLPGTETFRCKGAFANPRRCAFPLTNEYHLHLSHVVSGVYPTIEHSRRAEISAMFLFHKLSDRPHR